MERKGGPIRHALDGFCPGCGQGKLFRGWASLQVSCSACGLEYARLNAGDGPASLMIFVYGSLIVPLAFGLELMLAPPLWVHAVLWGVVMLAATMVSLRPIKAVMIGLQYRHQTPEV